MKTQLIISFLVLSLITPYLQADDWYRLSGKYSTVEYEPALESIADSILKIADNSIPTICKLVGVPLESYQKKKARIIVTDVLDVSNGFAIENTVVIFSLSSDYLTSWTGNQTWYIQVLNHELVHLVNFRKLHRTVNIFGTVSYITVPNWLWEGLAQYFSESWNAYRGDLYLKRTLLEGKLDLDDLKSSTDYRLMYATAHAFTRYLADQFGDSSFIKLLSYKESGFFYDFEAAFKDTYKESVPVVFKRFLRHIILFYGDKYANYTQKDMGQKLPDFGYQTEQIIPLSSADSTYLVSARLSRNHLYLSAVMTRLRKDKFQIVEKLFNDHQTELVLSPDQNLIAYGRYHLGQHNNLETLAFDWYVFNHKTGKKKRIMANIHARQAVFATNDDLILIETQPDASVLRRINLQNGRLAEIYRCSMPLGQITKLTADNYLLEAQRPNGNRDLFLLNKSGLTAVTDDSVDDRRPAVMDDSLFYFNRIIGDKTVLCRYNLRQEKYDLLLNDQFDYWVHDFDPRSNSLFLSSWQFSDRRDFFKRHIDSLPALSPEAGIVPINELYSRWTRKVPAPNLLSQPDSSQSQVQFTATKKRGVSPYFPMIHGFSFVLPVFDDQYKTGIYGSTIWLEVLRRQMLWGMFLIYPADLDRSLIIFNHFLTWQNMYISSFYYHGPVIFNTDKDTQFKLDRDYLALEISRLIFLQGNNRYSISPSLALSWERYDPSEALPAAGEDMAIQDPEQYTMSRIGMRYEYHLPTRLYPLLAEKKIGGYFYFHQSLQPHLKFQIQDLGLEAATDLFLSNLGLHTRIHYLKNTGDNPPFQILGIDRFYQYDFPRDLGYTRPIRGINRDISGRELCWTSNELILYLMEHTPFVLLILPVENLAVHGYVDYAWLKNIQIQEIYSYGTEITFGSTYLRLGAGYAWSKLPGEQMDQTIYMKVGLSMPMVSAQYRKVIGLPE